MTKLSAIPVQYQASPKDSQVLKIVLKFVNEKELQKENAKYGIKVGQKFDSMKEPKKEMASAWRVISFFFVVFVLPTILISVPLYARYHVYNAKTLYFTDGDMSSLHEGVSSFWCQGQRIIGNGSFVAYLTPRARVLKKKLRRSHIHSEILLTDDAAEEWGVHLVRGSSFTFSSCSRWPGGGLVVVKGEENLKKCFYREQRVKEAIQGQQHRRITRGVRRTLSPEEISDNGGTGGEVLDGNEDPEQEQFIRKFNTKSKESDELPLLQSNKKKSTRKKTKSNVKSRRKLKRKIGPSDIALTYFAEHAFFDPYSKIWHIKPSLKHGTSFVRQRDGDLVSVPWNETVDVYAGNSSYSSSEEYLEQCKDTIYSIELTPYIDCSSMAFVSKHKRNITWSVQVNESDFYYFIFTSDNSLERNTVPFDLYIERKLYNISSPLATCANKTECVFPLKFWQSAGAIIDFTERYDQISSLEEMRSYEVTYTCQPRSVVYTVLIMLVPFVIILFAFR